MRRHRSLFETAFLAVLLFLAFKIPQVKGLLDGPWPTDQPHPFTLLLAHSILTGVLLGLRWSWGRRTTAIARALRRDFGVQAWLAVSWLLASFFVLFMPHCLAGGCHCFQGTVPYNVLVFLTVLLCLQIGRLAVALAIAGGRGLRRLAQLPGEAAVLPPEVH